MKGRCDVCLEQLPESGVLGINSSDIVSGFGMVTFQADQFDDAAHFDAAVCGPRCAAAMYQMKLENAIGSGPVSAGLSNEATLIAASFIRRVGA